MYKGPDYYEKSYKSSTEDGEEYSVWQTSYRLKQ